VYVVSGDSSDNVVNAVGHIPGLGLAASNGGHFSPPPRPGQTYRTWQTFDLGVDWDAVKRVSVCVVVVVVMCFFSLFTHVMVIHMNIAGCAACLVQVHGPLQRFFCQIDSL
jgi:hypothetical protein